MKRVITVLAAASLLLIPAGCADHTGKWDSTDYTIEEIQSMLSSPCSKYISERDEKDLSDRALAGYNKMLGFAENYMGLENYRIYDFYWAYPDSGESYEAFVIKVVPEGYEDELEKNKDAAVMLTCDTDTMLVKEQLSRFIFARSWTERLSSAIAEKFPEYHMNTFYLGTEYYCLPTHIDDPENAPISNMSDATVNIFVKPGTDEADQEKIYSELEPILREYSVSSVNIAAPASQKELDNIIAEESFTSNSYYYDRDGIDWLKSYAVKP